MLTTHKISADFYDDNFQLIAIHCGLEDYAMGYAINFICGLRLKRMKSDLELNQSLSFSMFEWEDGLSDNYWTLIANKCAIMEIMPSSGLFENSTSSIRTDYLIKEKREVDYFLKVDAGCELIIDSYVELINKIPSVITAYQVNAQTLKSKRNLIF
ncbi:IPExxxVDY family protein [uncultured Allomuricauda sp.]|uniref:IPExxxVDY family protein n=1 Tax=Flagellimonas sp. W118 TaxID=3410791 RepID=UPI002632ADE1|nr:IPExxxVDY family protein [uncultured Allomuricauda sp.]